ncbi:MAG: hypothetical protein AB7P99_03040 [Vicinamibacterales bacterium]
MIHVERTGPAVPILLGKMSIGVAWFAAASYAAGILLRSSPRHQDVFAALFLVVAPLVWWSAKSAAMGRADEMHQQVATRGLLHGLIVANLWAGLMIGGSALSSLFLGDGEVNVSGMMQSAVVFVSLQPATAFLLSETTAFGILRGYAKREG